MCGKNSLSMIKWLRHGGASMNTSRAVADLRNYLNAILDCEATLLTLSTIDINGNTAAAYLTSRDVCHKFILDTQALIEQQRTVVVQAMDEVEQNFGGFVYGRDDLQRMSNDLSRDISELKNACDDLNASIKNSNNERYALSAVRDTHKNTVDGLEASKRNIDEQVQKIDKDIEACKQRQNAPREEQRKVYYRKENLERERNDLGRKRNDLERKFGSRLLHREQLEHLTRETERLNYEIRQANEMMKKLQNEIDSIEQEISALKSKKLDVQPTFITTATIQKYLEANSALTAVINAQDYGKVPYNRHDIERAKARDNIRRKKNDPYYQLGEAEKGLSEIDEQLNKMNAQVSHNNHELKINEGTLRVVNHALETLSNRSKLDGMETVLNKFEILSVLFWDTKFVLNKLYSIGIVHRKYQNITAVSSILDYLETGRTRSLIWNGSDPGAYNLYEDDVKANRIVGAIESGFDKMSQLISQELHKIQQNQYALYDAVQNSNKLLTYLSLASREILNRVDSISSEMRGVSGWLAAINSGLSGISSELYANTMATYHSGANLEGLRGIEKELSRNTEILSIVNSDDWGYLRNYEGTAIYND